jgi:Holliday junction resolvase RusA-like endonuclease
LLDLNSQLWDLNSQWSVVRCQLSGCEPRGWFGPGLPRGIATALLWSTRTHLGARLLNAGKRGGFFRAIGNFWIVRAGAISGPAWGDFRALALAGAWDRSSLTLRVSVERLGDTNRQRLNLRVTKLFSLRYNRLRLSVAYYHRGVTVRIDTDNLVKPIQDALIGLVYHDDQLVTHTFVSKTSIDGFYQIRGRSLVELTAFSQGDEFVYISVDQAPINEQTER